MTFLSRVWASIALEMGQSVSGFCDLNTCDESGRVLLSDRGEAVTVVRVLGVRRVLAEGVRRLADHNGLSLDAFRYDTLDGFFALAERAPFRRAA